MKFNEITSTQDGKYRWLQKVNLYKDIMLPLELCKIFAIASAVPVILLMIMSIAERKFTEQFWLLIKLYCLQAGLLALLTVIGYYLFYLPIGGWISYILFEISEERVVYYQFKGSVDIDWLTSQADALCTDEQAEQNARSATLRSTSASNMSADFAKVKRIVVYKSFGIIKLVLGDFSRSIIYLDKDELSTMLGHIRHRCPAGVKVRYRP